MKVGFKNSFLKSIQKIRNFELKEDIFEVISNVENAQNLIEIQNLKKLKGYSVYFRIRVGDYRIGIKWVEESQTVFFVTFDHRKDIYKKFP